MAQRGGSVASHLRIAKGEVFSSLIPQGQADVIIALEPGEAVRAYPYLKNGGQLITSSRAVYPSGIKYDDKAVLDWLRTNVPTAVILDGDALLQTCTAKSVNVAMLGAAAALGVLPFEPQALENTISSFGKPQFVENNLLALNYGKKLIIEQSSGGKSL
jgi:indolepyruvate ferredoxin oxidoreductase beta subunit